MINYFQQWDLFAVGIIIVMTVIIGFIVFFGNSKSATNKTFLGLTVFTALWGILNYLSYQSQFAIQAFLILRLTVFSVTWLVLFFLLFSISFPNIKINISKIFIRIFIAWASIVSLLTLTPLVFEKAGEISSTGTIISVINGPLLPVFGMTTLGYVLAGIIVLFVKIFKSKKENRNNFLLITAGVVFMFLFIAVSNFIMPVLFNNSSYLPIAVLSVFPFIILTSYTITQRNIFNVKLIGAEVFLVILLLLTLFQFIQAPDLFAILLRGAIFISLLGIGVLLIKNIMREVEQKEELASLNDNLQILLKQRESLTHLVTHKVKGSFTRTKVLFASMLDGTFGEISPEIRKRAQQGLEFDNGGLETVDLVLNVANIQNGIIKYDMQPVDFKELVEKTISEKRIPAEAKGLKIEEVEIKEGNYNVLGDSIWLKEAINNLIENSIKYTKEGKIMVGLERVGDKVLFSVKDTGVGINEEDKKNLFTEGGRGKDSIKVNVDSTGYGLYTVKLVIEGHNGRVWLESEGTDKGSQFYIELPAKD